MQHGCQHSCSRQTIIQHWGVKTLWNTLLNKMQLNPKTTKHILAITIHLSGVNSFLPMIHLCWLQIFPWHMVLHMMETLLGKWFIHASRLVELHPVTPDYARTHKKTAHDCFKNVERPTWCLKKTNTKLLDEGLPMQGHAMFVLAGCWMWLMWLWGQKLESLRTKPWNFGGCASLNLPDIWNLLSHLLHFYAYFFETKSVSRVSATSFEFMIHSCWSLPLNGSAPKRSFPAKSKFNLESDDMWW